MSTINDARLRKMIADILEPQRMYGTPSLGPMRIVETPYIPGEHVADDIVFIRDHPLWAWYARRILRKRHYAGGFYMRGKPVYRFDKAFVRDNILYCHPSMARALREGIKQGGVL